MVPKKQIVYYVDRATPDQWKKYIKQGIEDWQVAFEAAGFKDAIIAKEPPTVEEDPEWSSRRCTLLSSTLFSITNTKCKWPSR